MLNLTTIASNLDRKFLFAVSEVEKQLSRILGVIIITLKLSDISFSLNSRKQPTSSSLLIVGSLQFNLMPLLSLHYRVYKYPTAACVSSTTTKTRLRLFYIAYSITSTKASLSLLFDDKLIQLLLGNISSNASLDL